MQTEMFTRLNDREGQSPSALRPGSWIRSATRTLLVGIAALTGGASAVDIKVPAKIGATTAIQEAIDQCPEDGCRILLQGPTYTLANTLFIRNKSNITLMSATPSGRPELIFQDDGSKAGPDSDPDTLAMKPAGWKHWPMDGSDNVGGAGCPAQKKNPFTTSGIQRNGTILIQGSHNITIENLIINGKAPLGWGSMSVWESKYPTFYGNFGINLYLSGKVTIRNTEIKNCFSAVFIMNRNKGGVLAHNNAADCDKTQLAPGSRYAEMGGHIIEQSYIHDNVWAGFEESGDDLGNTWRFNRIYNNHNSSATFDAWMNGAGSPCYDASNFSGSTPKACKNDEAKNHVGGFLFLKDNVGAPDRVYNNTFHKVTNLFGWGGWRGGTQHYFYNNIVSEPWLDYNSDTSGFLTKNFIDQFKDYKNLTTKMGNFAYNNTFAYFPRLDIQGTPTISKTACAGNADSCKTRIAALKAAVWPTGRLSFQTQNVQGMNFTVAGQSKYLAPLKPISYIDGIQYQGDQRRFAFQSWKLEAPNSNVNKVPYTSTVQAADNGKDAGVTQPFTYQGKDSSVIASRFGRLFGLPDADTIGVLLSMGAELDTGAYRKLSNCYIKSVPMDLNPTSKTFLTPIWTDKGIDSCVENRAWTPGGASFTSGGKVASRGAIQPEGQVNTQVLTISDDQPAFINGKLSSISFDLSSTLPGLTNLQWVFAQLIPTVPFGDGGTEFTGTSAPIAIPLTSFSAAPVIGGNQVSIQLPAAAKGYSRIEVIVAGTTPDGQRVMSNLAVWVIRQSDYTIAATFHGTKFNTKDTADTVVAGKPVWMRLEPLQHILTVEALGADSCTKLKKINPQASCDVSVDKTQRYTALLNTFSIKGVSMFDTDPNVNGSQAISATGLYKGGKYPATGLDSSATNVMWMQVYFTKSGTMAPVMTALGQGDTGKVFQGVGSIFVRPDVPYVAELRDPASYNLVGENDSIPMIPFRAKYKTFVDVKDKWGNMVDVTSKVTLTVTPNPLDGYVGGGTDHEITLDVPATGIGQTVTQAISVPGPIPALNYFWLKTMIGAAGSQVAGTLKDSSKVHVGKASMLYDWDKDSLNGTVKDVFKITLSIFDGDLKLLPTSGYKASLQSKSGKLKFYLASDAAFANPLDSADVNATGAIDLVVTSSEEVLNDAIYAVNADVNSGEPAVIMPVNFKKPPEPPYPSADSAAYLDTDCDGKADLLRVWLKGSPTSTADLDTTKTPFHKMSLTVGSKLVTYDSTEWKFATGRTDLLEFAVKGATELSNIPGKDLLLQYTMRRPPLADTVVDAGIAINVKDRVAPRVDSAVVIENYSSAYDVFIVRFTEPVASASDAWPFLVKGATSKVTTSIKVDEFVADPANSLGPNTYRLKIHGNRDAQFSPLYINYSDSIKVDPASTLVDGANNHGSDCAPMIALVKKAVLPSFTGKITSNDSKGRANVVTLTFSRAILSQEHIDSIQVDFNGYSKMVVTGANWTTTNNITWTLVLPDPFPYGVTRGTSADNFGANVTVHGTNLNPPVATYLPSSGKVVDSVPAVLVGFIEPTRPYAQLTFGNGVDSLRIKLSEPVTSIAGTSGLSNVSTGKDVGTTAIVEVDAQTWIVVQDTLNTNRVNAGDSVSLGDRFKGGDGLSPTQGANASKAIVIGGDRGPVSAFYSDSNGVGTASQLTLTFAKALTREAKFQLAWPNKDGSLASIVVTSTGAIGQKSYSFDLAGKFPVGVTGSALKDLGVMTSIFTGSDTDFVTTEFPPHVRFSIADSVAPIIDSARMIFGTYESSDSKYDTLKLYFSEPVKVNGSDFNKAFSKQIGNTDVALTPALPKLVLADDGLSGFMIFDTTTGMVAPENLDSIRLIAGVDGGIIADQSNAVAAAKAKRTVVKAGLRKAIAPMLNIILPNPNNKTRTDREKMVLKPIDGVSPLKKTNSNVAILIGSSENVNSGFTVVSKSAPANTGMTWGELDGTIGIDIPVNTGTIGVRSLITVVLYDSYGTFVGNAEAELSQDDFDTTNTSKSGKSSIKILWDGRSAKDQVVSSGVYMARVLFYREDLQIDNTIKRVMIYNKIKHIGVAR